MATASGGDTRWENESSTAGILSPVEDENSSVRSASDKLLKISNDLTSSTDNDQNDKQGIGNNSIANCKTSTTNCIETVTNLTGELTTLVCCDSDTHKETTSSNRENAPCFGCESQHIVNICDDCLDNFCIICTKHHMKLNPKHILSSLPCAGSAEVPKTMCTKHPDSPVESLCTQCSLFICSSQECIDAHQVHSPVAIQNNIRPVQLLWSKYFDNILHSIHALQKRKHLAREVLEATPYSRVLDELERREVFMIDAIKTQTGHERTLILKQRDESVKHATLYVTKLDDSLKLAEKMRSNMAAAYQEGDSSEADVIVSAIQKFKEHFPSIKHVSESVPITPERGCSLVLEASNLNTTIADALKCVTIQHPLPDNSEFVYSKILTEKHSALNFDNKNSLFFRHVSFGNVYATRITLCIGAKDVLFHDDFYYFSYSDDTLQHNVLEDCFSNIVSVGDAFVINGTRGIHLLDDETLGVTYTATTNGINHTFISRYSDTEFIALIVRQTGTGFYIFRALVDECKMDLMQSFDFDRRLVPQHHNQMFGISDGRVVLTEDGESLILVHLELDMVESHNLEKQLAGAVINCVYVDYILNILVGCSDGKIYMFGRDKQLRLIYEMDKPITGLLGCGDTLYIAAFPNAIRRVSFAGIPGDKNV